MRKYSQTIWLRATRSTGRGFRRAIERAYKEAASTLGEPTDPLANDRLRNGLRRLCARIRHLNDTTFSDGLFAMLDTYRVPLVGIKDRIVPAVNARHAIIHEGQANEEYEELTFHVAVLRELLKRIILTLLEYKGRYISFLNGQEFLEFAPTTVTE